MIDDSIIIVVMQEEQGWSAGSPQLGVDFVVLAPTREAVIAKVEELLAPLAAHGLRYGFVIDKAVR